MDVSSASELRLPADPRYIVVAKRAAAAFASVAGFDLESIDDLCIAVAQACENAIDCVCESAGAGRGQIRISFDHSPQGLVVEVRSSCSRSAVEAETARRAAVQEQRRRSAAEREEIASATDLALRLMGLFVDDHSYRIDRRTGGMHVRLMKYRVS